MGIQADWGGPRENPDLGLHSAVCAFVEDIGWQHNEKYKKVQHQVVIMWELDQKMSDGRPFMVSQRYSLILGEKSNLYRDLTGWLGRPPKEGQPVDLSLMVGRMCSLNLIENEKGRVRIQSITPAMRDAPKLTVSNKEPPAWVAKEREKAVPEPQNNDRPDDGEPPPHTDDDLPF